METKQIREEQVNDVFSSNIERNEQNIIIPLVEEKAFVDKRVIETGKVRVTKTVSEHEVVVDEPLFHEQVTVERVPVNQFVEQPPQIRQEGDVMIIPVVEERLVTQRRLMLVEELRVRKQVIETHQPQTVVLRREAVDVRRVAETENSGDTN